MTIDLILMFAGAVTAAFAALYFGQKLLQKVAKSFAYSRIALQLKVVKVEGEKAQTIIGEFLQLHGNTNFASRSNYYDEYNLLALLGLAETQGFSIMEVQQECDLQGTYCNVVWKLTHATGLVIFMSGTTRSELYLDEKDRPLHKFHEETGMDFVFYTEEGKVPTISRLMIVFPTTEIENVEVKNLLRTIEVSELEHLAYDDTDKAKVASVFRIGKEGRLFRTQLSIPAMKLQNLSRIYPLIKMNAGGMEAEILAGDAIKIAVASLAAGDNLFIKGPYGTGKTQFNFRVAQMLGSMPNTRAITITANELLSVSDNTSLIEALTGQFATDFGDKKMRNVLFIEEAELLLSSTNSAIVSFMRSILDGQLSNQWNLAVSLEYNAADAQLDGGTLRAGRKQLVYELGPLTEGEANMAVSTFKFQMTDKIFDEEKFKTLLAQENKTDAGESYCPRNRIVLADLLTCFVDRSFKDRIQQLITKVAPTVLLEQKPVLPVLGLPATAPKAPAPILPTTKPAEPLVKPAVPNPRTSFGKRRGRK